MNTCRHTLQKINESEDGGEATSDQEVDEAEGEGGDEAEGTPNQLRIGDLSTAEIDTEVEGITLLAHEQSNSQTGIPHSHY